jgi:galactonate dehydratase
VAKQGGPDAEIDFHGRFHRGMAKQMASLLEPHRPLFNEETLLSEHLHGFKQT